MFAQLVICRGGVSHTTVVKVATPPELFLASDCFGYVLLEGIDSKLTIKERQTTGSTGITAGIVVIDENYLSELAVGARQCTALYTQRKALLLWCKFRVAEAAGVL